MEKQGSGYPRFAVCGAAEYICIWGPILAGKRAEGKHNNAADSRAAPKLARRESMELSVIGVPKTIDNDLTGTDHSPGYGSATRFAAMTAAEIGADAAVFEMRL